MSLSDVPEELTRHILSYTGRLSRYGRTNAEFNRVTIALTNDELYRLDTEYPHWDTGYDVARYYANIAAIDNDWDTVLEMAEYHRGSVVTDAMILARIWNRDDVVRFLTRNYGYPDAPVGFYYRSVDSVPGWRVAFSDNFMRFTPEEWIGFLSEPMRVFLSNLSSATGNARGSIVPIRYRILYDCSISVRPFANTLNWRAYAFSCNHTDLTYGQILAVIPSDDVAPLKLFKELLRARYVTVAMVDAIHDIATDHRFTIRSDDQPNPVYVELLPALWAGSLSKDREEDILDLPTNIAIDHVLGI